MSFNTMPLQFSLWCCLECVWRKEDVVAISSSAIRKKPKKKEIKKLTLIPNWRSCQLNLLTVSSHTNTTWILLYPVQGQSRIFYSMLLCSIHIVTATIREYRTKIIKYFAALQRNKWRSQDIHNLIDSLFTFKLCTEYTRRWFTASW